MLGQRKSPDKDIELLGDKRFDLEKEITAVLNRYSMENGSDTPDFILARYLLDCLVAWNRATALRTLWYRPEDPSSSQPTEPTGLPTAEPTGL